VEEGHRPVGSHRQPSGVTVERDRGTVERDPGRRPAVAEGARHAGDRQLAPPAGAGAADRHRPRLSAVVQEHLLSGVGDRCEELAGRRSGRHLHRRGIRGGERGRAGGDDQRVHRGALPQHLHRRPQELERPVDRQLVAHRQGTAPAGHPPRPGVVVPPAGEVPPGRRRQQQVLGAGADGLSRRVDGRHLEGVAGTDEVQRRPRRNLHGGGPEVGVTRADEPGVQCGDVSLGERRHHWTVGGRAHRARDLTEDRACVEPAARALDRRVEGQPRPAAAAPAAQGDPVARVARHRRGGEGEQHGRGGAGQGGTDESGRAHRCHDRSAHTSGDRTADGR